MTYNEKILNELNDVLDKLNPDIPENTYYEEEPTVILLNELYKIAQDKVNKIIEKYKLDESEIPYNYKRESIENAVIPTLVDLFLDGNFYGETLEDKYKDYVEVDGVVTDEEFNTIVSLIKNNIKDHTSDRASMYTKIAEKFFNKKSKLTEARQEEILNKLSKKKLTEAGTTETMIITDGTKTTELDYNSLDFGLGDYYYNGNETGAQIGFYWNEDKDMTFVVGLYLNVYVGNDEENDLETLDKTLKNLTPDEAFKVTLSKEDYQTFLKWKEMCDVKEFTYWDSLFEDRGESKLNEGDIKKEYRNYCDDLGIDPNKKSSKNRFMKDYAKNYTTMNGIKDLESKLADVKKDLEESEQLNESSDYELTSPSGKFWIGDPCYVLSDDVYYGVWNDKYNFKDGKIDTDDTLSFIVHGTAYGDGAYEGSNGFTYGVDSGTLAVIPIELVSKEDGVSLGTIETGNKVEFDYIEGTFKFDIDGKTIKIDTDI